METISSKQTELDTFIAEGYKTALSEERRRYCFLVDRQCAVAKNSSAYHGKVSPKCQWTTRKIKNNDYFTIKDGQRLRCVPQN